MCVFVASPDPGRFDVPLTNGRDREECCKHYADSIGKVVPVRVARWLFQALVAPKRSGDAEEFLEVHLSVLFKYALREIDGRSCRGRVAIRTYDEQLSEVGTLPAIRNSGHGRRHFSGNVVWCPYIH